MRSFVEAETLVVFDWLVSVLQHTYQLARGLSAASAAGAFPKTSFLRSTVTSILRSPLPQPFILVHDLTSATSAALRSLAIPCCGHSADVSWRRFCAVDGPWQAQDGILPLQPYRTAALH